MHQGAARRARRRCRPTYRRDMLDEVEDDIAEMIALLAVLDDDDRCLVLQLARRLAEDTRPPRVVYVFEPD